MPPSKGGRIVAFSTFALVFLAIILGASLNMQRPPATSNLHALPPSEIHVSLSDLAQVVKQASEYASFDEPTIVEVSSSNTGARVVEFYRADFPDAEEGMRSREWRLRLEQNLSDHGSISTQQSGAPPPRSSAKSDVNHTAAALAKAFQAVELRTPVVFNVAKGSAGRTTVLFNYIPHGIGMWCDVTVSANLKTTSQVPGS